MERRRMTRTSRWRRRRCDPRAPLPRRSRRSRSGPAGSPQPAQRLASDLLATERARRCATGEIRRALDASIAAARAEVDRASDFIATRRGGVRRRARTRLAEADRLLAAAEAERDADPKQAMADAQRADKLAGEAYSLAPVDFDAIGTAPGVVPASGGTRYRRARSSAGSSAAS